MLLKIKNVGRLKPAEVKIDGLTVICGNNTTGKSTIGKVLYCIYSAFYDIENSIRSEKRDLILNYFRMQKQDSGLRTQRGLAYSLEDILNTDPQSEKDLRIAVENILKKYSTGQSREYLQDIINEIRQILQVDEKEVVMTFLERQLNTEFEGHFGNVNHPKKQTTVELDIKDKCIAFSTVGANERLKINQYFSLEKQIIYLDDPFLLDHINDRLYYFIDGYNIYGHRNQMSSKIRERRLFGTQTAVIEEILRNQKLKDILDMIRQISDGEVVVEDGKIVYHQSNLRKNLGMASLSTGVKTFLILKELLLNGDLEENGMMIIDEPEVHLHPDWQIKFAEVIVMLQKAYRLNIVLTTHSMDFLSALVTYAKEYGINDTCNYYLTQLEEEKEEGEFPLAELKWMNNNIQGLYASVSEPFEKLYQKMDIGDFDL